MSDRRNLSTAVPFQPFKPLSTKPAAAPTRPFSSKGLTPAFAPVPIPPRQVRPTPPLPPIPPRPPEDPDGWSKFTEIKDSSHIYAIAYNYNTNQCAVTFKAPSKGATIYGDIPSLCSQEFQSWTFRSWVPATTYVYGDTSKPFPLSLFDSFKKAPSKGRFLWENIRGCEADGIYPFSIYDVKEDGSIYLPSYDGGINQTGVLSNAPTQPPKR